MKIGITERGDAGLDLSWEEKLSYVDGAVLITKQVTSGFQKAVLRQEKPLIVHATCTGWGGTFMEPYVPGLKKQMEAVRQLIEQGFSASHVVIRIDPIIPNTGGIRAFLYAMEAFERTVKPLGVSRVRISILDEYPHVRKRFATHGIEPIYGGKLYPRKEQVMEVAKAVAKYPDITFEACAEPNLVKICSNVVEQGCISTMDLALMGLSMSEQMAENPQGRKGCHCLSCKTELLENKCRCSHKCEYCYWR